ncbi:MAG: xylose isomerase-like TIM barrel [Prolixibacteraceae bacterium]|nr:MAG: xylose isomerase-like TIM barrel [Prolixibacteraceae bacterium]
MERRNFIKSTAVTAAWAATSGTLNAAVISGSAKKRPIHVFTKCLQFLSFDEIAEILAEQGFDGADLTVRTNGQVLPENVSTGLPKALKALRKAGVDSNMIVTEISNPDDPVSNNILKTMADLGIGYYRMGYLDFDSKKSIPQNLDEHKIIFEKLEKLNRKYGIHGDYQNHSGTRVGGPVWDLYHLLKDRDPEFIGVQYDIRHATVEGGVSWPLGLKLLAPWIKTTNVKDFVWVKAENGKWQIKNVPPGEGMVDFNTYFELYKSFNIEAPVSIHYEYDLGGAEHGNNTTTMSLDKIKKFLVSDLLFLKNKFKETGIEE